MGFNSNAPDNLCHVIENLRLQVEASKFWQCPFAGCTGQVSREALPDLEAFVSTLRDSHEKFTGGYSTLSTTRQILKLTEELDKIACPTHQPHIEGLYFLDEPAQQVDNETSSASPFPKTPPKRTSVLGPNTPYSGRSGTAERYDDDGYFSMSPEKAKKGLRASQSFYSPYASGTDRVFDVDSPEDKVDTPATNYSETPGSKIAFTRQLLNETPIRNKPPKVPSISHIKSEEDQDEAALLSKSAEIAGTEDVVVSEDEHDDNSLGNAFRDEDLSNASWSTTGENSHVKGKYHKGINNVTGKEVAAIKAFRPNLQAKSTEKLFRARALLHDVLNSDYGKSHKKFGKIYVAVDVEDKQLKGCFKVGVVHESRTVWARYNGAKCLRKGYMRFVAISDGEIPGAGRVERLVQRELHAERKFFHCKHCETSHQEWFKTDLQTVIRAVNRWTMFTSLVPSNNEDEETLTAKAKKFMETTYDLDHFVQSFISAEGYRSQPRDLVTLVGGEGEGKTLTEMREWETSAADPGQDFWPPPESTEKGTKEVRGAGKKGMAE